MKTLLAVVDNITALVETGASYGVVGAAVIVAYRLTRQARIDAVTLYKQAADDANAVLEAERAAWRLERQGLLDRIADLEQ